MSFIIKFAKGIRTHWKKSIFGACVLTWGGNWVKTKYEIEQLMRVYCEEALKYGEVAISGSVHPRTVTVILNPAANKRKSVDNFEKYCAPILNLSGISVEVIQTESEGHAKQVVQTLKSTDAVIVAGGDGTLSEVVTGLLRRTGENNGKSVPIGVLPLGRHNKVGVSLFPGGDHLTHVKSMADASLAIVREATKPLDVMKIEIIDENSEEGKPVYALSEIEWGAYRDAKAKIDKYWYYGPLKKYATYIFNGYKNNLNWSCEAIINYSPPCSGCSNCSIRVYEDSSKKWYQKFISSQNNNLNKSLNLLNAECSVIQEKKILTSDLALLSSNIIDGPPKLHLNLGPHNLDYFKFVSDGWKTETGKRRTINETIEARQVIIKPNISREDKNDWFSIDNEEFEVKPIKITLLPKLINIFCKNNI